MTKEEAFDKITSELKWYVGIYSQGYASQLVQRFNAGQLKQSTIDSFLEKFGYVKSTPAKYVRQLDGRPKKLKTK